MVNMEVSLFNCEPIMNHDDRSPNGAVDDDLVDVGSEHGASWAILVIKLPDQ